MLHAQMVRSTHSLSVVHVSCFVCFCVCVCVTLLTSKKDIGIETGFEAAWKHYLVIALHCYVSCYKWLHMEWEYLLHWLVQVECVCALWWPRVTVHVRSTKLTVWDKLYSCARCCTSMLIGIIIHGKKKCFWWCDSTYKKHSTYPLQWLVYLSWEA